MVFLSVIHLIRTKYKPKQIHFSGNEEFHQILCKFKAPSEFASQTSLWWMRPFFSTVISVRCSIRSFVCPCDLSSSEVVSWTWFADYMERRRLVLSKRHLTSLFAFHFWFGLNLLEKRRRLRTCVVWSLAVQTCVDASEKSSGTGRKRADRET